MPENSSDGDRQETTALVALDGKVKTEVWRFMIILLFVVGVMLPFPYSGFVRNAAIIAIMYLSPKWKSRLRRLLITEQGVLLEYPGGPFKIPGRKKTLSWSDIAGLKTWHDKKGFIKAIGLRLADDSSLIIRNLERMDTLQLELMGRAKLQVEGKTRLDRFSVDSGLGDAIYLAAFVIALYMSVIVWKGQGQPSEIGSVLAGMARVFTASALLLAANTVCWGRVAPPAWERPAPFRFWSVLFSKRPVLRGVLTACLAGAGILLIALSPFSF